MASIIQASCSQQDLTNGKHQKAEKREDEESGSRLCNFYPLSP